MSVLNGDGRGETRGRVRASGLKEMGAENPESPEAVFCPHVTS